MGLDMYLYRINNHAIKYIEYDNDIDEIKEKNPKLYAEMKPYIVTQGTHATFMWESLFEKIGYWRKAHQIHDWLVENVQEGNDDCGYYEVYYEQLEELLSICKKILEKSVLIIAPIYSGVSRNSNGKTEKVYNTGKKILNPEVAEQLLPSPTWSSPEDTDYNEYYIYAIKDTVDILEKMFAKTDFSTHSVFYSSSW